MEQSKKTVVLGRINGIANNQPASDEFLTALEISNTVETFCEEFKIEDKQGHKRDYITSLQAPENLELIKAFKILKRFSRNMK